MFSKLTEDIDSYTDFYYILSKVSCQKWYITNILLTLFLLLFSVSEAVELRAVVEVVEQGVPEKEETPPLVEPGQLN